MMGLVVAGGNWRDPEHAPIVLRVLVEPDDRDEVWGGARLIPGPDIEIARLLVIVAAAVGPQADREVKDESAHQCKQHDFGTHNRWFFRGRVLGIRTSIVKQTLHACSQVDYW